MPLLVNRPPSYRHHRSSGQAVVTLNGHDIYLGKYRSRESRIAYDRIIAEWLKQKSALQWDAKCPAHDDRHASLSIGRGEGG